MVEFNGDVTRASAGHGANSRPQNEPILKAVADKILIDFKKKDKDGDLYVSYDEIADAIIEEYVRNGYSREDAHAAGETIVDKLAWYQNRAKEYDGNKDNKLNIDEYTGMFRKEFEEDYSKTHGEVQNNNTPPAEEASVPFDVEPEGDE